MELRLTLAAVIAFGVATLSGCATSRSELRLATPAITASAVASPDAPIAVIRVVKDDRRFEAAPSDPSTPSLGFEGSDNASVALKQRAIGRKRNTFGKALGDVLLQEGQTVEGLVRETVASALREKGYNVQSQAGAAPPRLQVDVRIAKFWAWVQPGFWAITVKSDIAVEVVPATGSAITLAASVEDPRQLVTEGAWIETIEKALQALRVDAIQKLPPAR